VRDNLTYLNSQATVADLDRATETLGLRPVLDRLGGYEAQLGVDGAGLSAGERQLIAITRIYIADARIIVLDEATCHLDLAAEARVEKAFANSGRTLVVIAHRISSARRAQMILLLDGTSATLGSHDDLLLTSAQYADLVGHWESGAQSRAALGPR